jgi:hypothetical protein
VAVADRRASGLAVERLEVLDMEPTVQEAVLALVVRYNGQVFACDRGLVDPDAPADPGRAALREALWAFGRLDQDTRATLSRARRRRKVMRGGHAGGAPSFGYRVESNVLVADEAEQAVIFRIVELRRVGASYRAIARALDEESLRPKRSDRWHPESLRRIARRFNVDTQDQG